MRELDAFALGKRRNRIDDRIAAGECTRAMHTDGTAAGWWDGVRSHWRLKVWLSVAMTAAFGVLYLSAQRFPIGAVRPAPETPLDAWIPWMPAAVYLYASLLLFQAILPWSMRDAGALIVYCRTLLLVTLAAAIVFVLVPTVCPRPADAGEANAFYRGMLRVDNPLNAFPSLHAAFAVYSALGCGRVFAGSRRRTVTLALLWAWAAAILAATLLTKQHVILDIVAGGALGWFGYLLFARHARLLAVRRADQDGAGTHRLDPEPVHVPGRSSE